MSEHHLIHEVLAVVAQTPRCCPFDIYLHYHKEGITDLSRVKAAIQQLEDEGYIAGESFYEVTDKGHDNMLICPDVTTWGGLTDGKPSKESQEGG